MELVKEIEKIKEEHENILLEIIEIESSNENGVINQSNLVHSLKQIWDIWDGHEEREEVVFDILAMKGFEINVMQIKFFHGKLKEMREDIIKKINSGSEAQIKECFEEEIKKMVKVLKEHIEIEDELLYTIDFETIK